MTLIAPRTAAAIGAAGATRGFATAMPRVSAAWLAVALITVAGFGLRLAAARGDLWLDELWSLDLVSPISSGAEVFWAIPHDNNHPLNSLWMYAVGQQASALVYRLPAVAFGTATILAMAWSAARVNAAAGVAAALLAALSYPFVDYGSEARGYAGLILALVVAADLSLRATDRLIEPARTGGPAPLAAFAVPWGRWPLAAVILFGTCSHLTMLVGAAMLGLATFARIKTAGWPLRAACDATAALFRPSVALLLPVLAAEGTGAAVHGGITIGGLAPFTMERFLHGYGGLLQMILGLPVSFPNLLAVVLAFALVAAGFAAGLVERRWLPMVVAALGAWPAVVLLAQIPNTDFARYFLTTGFVLPMILAEMAGRLWARGRLSRILAAAGVAVICAGQLPYLREMVVHGRGSPSAAVALIAADGPATFAARTTSITNATVATVAARAGLDVRPESPADLCTAPARWYIYDASYGEPAPDTIERAGFGCAWRYTTVAEFPTTLWSGRAWRLYKRDP